MRLIELIGCVMVCLIGATARALVLIGAAVGTVRALQRDGLFSYDFGFEGVC